MAEALAALAQKWTFWVMYVSNETGKLQSSVIERTFLHVWSPALPTE
jgi:hypothetical protein